MDASVRPAHASGPIDDVSIVVVNWNGGPLLRTCVAAAVEAARDVIVVDNESTDGSAETLAEAFPTVRLLQPGRNLGFAGGVNLGVSAARHDAVLLLNPDAVATADAVTRLRDTLIATPRAGAVGGCLVGGDGRPQRGFVLRRFPTLGSWATDLLLIDDVWPSNPVRLRYLAADVPLDGDAPRDVEQPAAACLMVSKAALSRIGGLDERFHPAWFEDVDLCRRLVAGGFLVLYEPRARVTHAGGVSLRSLPRTAFARIWYGNLRRYARRHHGGATNLALRGLIVVGMVLRLGVALLRRDTTARSAWLAVLRDTLRNSAPDREGDSFENRNNDSSRSRNGDSSGNGDSRAVSGVTDRR